MKLNLNPVTFIAGLLVALSAAGLLFLGYIESGPAAAVGIVGLGLIATSPFVSEWQRRRRGQP